jgi:hypothetical protein
VTTQLQVMPPKVGLVDPRTGTISREWYLFLLRDFERGGVMAGDIAALDARTDALEARPIAHTIEDEGVQLAQRTTLNFAGSGVTVTDAGGKTLVTIPGGGGQSPVQFQDEGANLGTAGTATSINFVGAGVTASRSLDAITVTIAGGGGGGGGNSYFPGGF